MRDVRAAGDQQGAMPASLSLLLDNASENSLPLTEPVPDAARLLEDGVRRRSLLSTPLSTRPGSEASTL
jgi:hypothetical protein